MTQPPRPRAGRTGAAAAARRVASSGLARAFGGVAAVNLAGAGLQFAMHASAAIILGAEAYGRFSYALAIAAVLVLATTMGWPLGLLRLVPEYAARGRWGLLRGAVSRAFWLSMLGAGIGGGGLIAAGLALRGAGFALADAVIWSAALMAPLSITRLSERALQSIGRPAASIAPEQIVAPVAVAVGLHAGLIADWLALLIAYAAAAGIASGVGWAAFLRGLPAEARAAPAEHRDRAWMREMLPLMVGMLSKRLMGRLDSLVLGAFAGPAAVGAYAAAVRLSQLAALGARTAGKLFPAKIAAAYYAGRHDRARRLVLLASLAAVAVALPPSAVALVAPEWLLGFFGPDFVVAAAPLTILVLGTLVLAASGVIDLTISVIGGADAYAWTTTTAAIFNAATLIALVPWLGASGAALSVSLTYCLLAFLQARWLRAKLGR